MGRVLGQFESAHSTELSLVANSSPTLLAVAEADSSGGSPPDSPDAGTPPSPDKNDTRSPAKPPRVRTASSARSLLAPRPPGDPGGFLVVVRYTDSPSDPRPGSSESGGRRQGRARQRRGQGRDDRGEGSSSFRQAAGARTLSTGGVASPSPRETMWCCRMVRSSFSLRKMSASLGDDLEGCLNRTHDCTHDEERVLRTTQMCNSNTALH